MHMNDVELRSDPYAHLKQHARRRADRTIERLTAGIAALRAADRNVTAEAIKQATRDLEPGFAGLSFQVIRRNPQGYALYREAAAAFTAASEDRLCGRHKRRARRARHRVPRASYDPLQRLDKRDLVRQVRTLELELLAEGQRRGALAYDQQTLLAKILRLEMEIVLLQAELARRE
jgi:hypothetical protein